jgi:NTE family protein
MSESQAGRADGVFEGGGVKGIAFAGAIAAAEEEAGVREWVNLAGASAGAITSALLAVGYNADEIRAALGKTEYQRFTDYGFGGRYVGGAINYFRIRGLCPGNYFKEWLADRFEEKLGKRDPTFADVVRTDLPADLTAEEQARARYRLRVIASDVTAGRMLVLPDDLEDFEDEQGRRFQKDDFPLVDAVRMSMSFPFVFSPVTLYQNRKPYFVVDGGLLSNFPIWLFDSPNPKRPTWGFRLHGGTGPERLPYRTIPRLFWGRALLKAMFFSAMEAWDRRHVGAVTTARTVSIGTRDIRTTQFELTKTQTDDLYTWGYEESKRFFREQRAYINSFGQAPEGAGANAVAAPEPS